MSKAKFKKDSGDLGCWRFSMGLAYFVSTAPRLYLDDNKVGDEGAKALGRLHFYESHNRKKNTSASPAGSSGGLPDLIE